MLGESHLRGVPWASSGSPPRHRPATCTAGRSSRSQHRPQNLQNTKEGSVLVQNVSLSWSKITDCNQPLYRKTQKHRNAVVCVCECVCEKCVTAGFTRFQDRFVCTPWLWWSLLERCPVFFQPNKQVQSSTLASDCEVQSVTVAIIISVLSGFQTERFVHSLFLAMSTYVSFKHEPVSIFWCQFKNKYNLIWFPISSHEAAVPQNFLNDTWKSKGWTLDVIWRRFIEIISKFLCHPVAASIAPTHTRCWNTTVAQD